MPGWGATGRAGVRGVSTAGDGAAWSSVSEPKWGAEDTHAGRWAGAGYGSLRAERGVGGVKREESPGKGTELFQVKRIYKQGLGMKQHGTYKGLIN